MATTTEIPANPVSILGRVISPEGEPLPRAAAEAILTWTFGENDRKRMNELGAKAREGTLSPAEEAELDGYLTVGHLLTMLHSRARRALNAAHD